MIYIYDHLEINIIIVQYMCSYVYHTQYMYIYTSISHIMVPIYTYIIVCILYIHIKKYIKSFCKENDDDDNNEFKKKSL